MDLKLTLHRKWFDKHLQDKKDEYRVISPYWCAKFLLINGKHKKKDFWTELYLFCDNKIVQLAISSLEDHLKMGMVSFKSFDNVVFSNGMKPVEILPRFEKEFKGMKIGLGKKEWGAPEEPVFIINCGAPQNIVNAQK